ncbi:DUF3817 domain-containing protein [Actinoplanes sp. CA-252034]|uniref:DUF3817 domain-containing protein n=1 Tax=Actinoplanes sp. CA-252034 TaxID=3239906 RepID=UPI003D97CBBA
MTVRIAAWVELITLSVMLINMLTVHIDVIASTCGPVHGCAYLIIVILTLNLTKWPLGIRLLALIPGIGGMLVLRRINRPG